MVEIKAKSKANALNYFIENLLEKPFFVIVDCDEKALSKALFGVKEGIVATKKITEEKSMMGRINNITTAPFFVFQKWLGKKGKALFNGSLAIIPKTIGKQLKFKNVVIEDIDFSIRAILKGKKIYYLDRVIGIGKEPSFSSFIKQQLRYAYGNGEVLREYFTDMLKKREKEVFLATLSLPMLSFFSSFSLVEVISSLFLKIPAFSFIVELLAFTAVFFMLVEKKQFLEFLLSVIINAVLLPFPRLVYFLLGLINIKKRFSTTH